MRWDMESANLRRLVSMIALTSVSDGRRRMVPPGEEFLTTDRRAAELLVYRFADVPSPEDQEAVLAIIDADPALLALIDRRNEMTFREAWVRGLTFRLTRRRGG